MIDLKENWYNFVLYFLNSKYLGTMAKMKSF